MVPRKHGKGGQSEQRFKRARKEALKHWFKESIETIESFRKGRKIYLGCSSVYKKSTKEIYEL